MDPQGAGHGSDAALKDAYHRPKEPVITEEAKAWVIHLACSKPKDLGYAAEVWTRSALARHVREHARKAGYASLAQAAKATVHRILAEQTLHPEKVKYYLERRDPEFETKMREVLLVYQEVALQNQKGGMIPLIITVSVDEKPGLQAIANTAPDLPPVPGKHSGLGRDHEYKRLGTCWILAALDLHNGHVTARVERRHRSREFVALLKDLEHCPRSGHPPDHGQSLRAHLERNSGISGLTAQSLPIRAHSQARVLAQYRRNLVWQDGQDLSPTYPGAILGGTPNPYPAGHCGNQCRSRGSSVEEVRGSDHRIVWVCFGETKYYVQALVSLPLAAVLPRCRLLAAVNYRGSWHTPCSHIASSNVLPSCSPLSRYSRVRIVAFRISNTATRPLPSFAGSKRCEMM